MILSTIFLSLLNAIAYRMGGSGNYPRWFRPVGIGVITMATLVLWSFIWDWWYLLGVIASGGASAGLSTTYFKNVPDARWWNWMFVGIALSIALLPFTIATGLWLGFFIRLAILTPAITLWSEIIGWDIAEEFGRGFLHVATIPLLFIGV